MQKLTRSSLIRSVIFTLVIITSSCSSTPAVPSEDIVGRWKVESQDGMSIPNSFFWFMMDYIEFRKDGTALGLLTWPPDGGSELRLNVTGRYSITMDNQIAFTGSCRYEDPCTGVYSLEFDADRVLLFFEDSIMKLQYISSPSDIIPPRVLGPMPTPTPIQSE